MNEVIAKAAVLIEALPYIQQFRDAIVVVKFGGSAMEDPEIVESTIRDIVFMECVGMRPVLVHGGGREISARLREMGKEPRFVNGLRYTGADTITVVDEVLHNDVNPRLVDAIVKFGGKGRTLSGKQILSTEKMYSRNTETGNPIDIGYVGSVSSVDIEKIKHLLDINEVPVITPLGAGKDGNTYNVNADIAAARIAEALQARKLVFLSDVPGILQDPADEATLISTISLNEIDELVSSGTISGGMVPKIDSACRALKAGTKKVHLIDGRLKHSLLLEIFTDKGVGTEILP